MLLLVIVTIYIWKKFSSLAELKGLNKNKWGALGALCYLGCGLGIPLTIGIFVGLGMMQIDFEDTGVNIILSLVSYAAGGFVAYLLYQKLSAMPDDAPDIDSFGKGE